MPRPPVLRRSTLAAAAVAIFLLAGCVEGAKLDEAAAAEAAREAEHAALVVELETARLAEWQELDRTLRAYFAGDASRAEALAVLRDAQGTYESSLARLNATTVPAAFEEPHGPLVESYRLGLRSLEDAEACLAGTDLFACARAPELGRASVEEHQRFVDAFPGLPEELAREFPMPVG